MSYGNLERSSEGRLLSLSKDQAIGCYVGAAIGDAYGVPFEFMEAEQIKDLGVRPEPIYWSGGSHDADEGEWSDDTSMARCIAGVYISCGQIDENCLIADWIDWMDHGFLSTRESCWDIGGQTRRSLCEYRDGRPFSYVDTKRSGEGNGGMMRLAPVITANSHSLMHASTDAVITSELTHPSSICSAYAERLVEVCFDMESVWESVEQYRKGGGHVRDTFFSAYEAFYTTDNFMDCIHKAICMGGDTDTIGCVAGMMAGARYGFSNIPSALVDGLMRSSDIVFEAELLYEIARATDSLLQNK